MRLSSASVAVYRMAEAAQLLGVSDDTLRRWVEAGRLDKVRTPNDVAGVDGVQLAKVAREIGDAPEEGSTTSSARNRLRGIVTAVKRDEVMAQVELCCGPYRVVSLMSREAADALQLEPGVVAVASVKSTNVVVEVS
jgi:molybdopterin-binding protein